MVAAGPDAAKGNRCVQELGKFVDCAGRVMVARVEAGQAYSEA